MLGILKLHNSIQPYAWGSRTAIAGLRGEPPTGEPEAELWMGAHPKLPSMVEQEDGHCTLPALIATRPQEVLGPHAAADDELPFLLKLLAADQPLSIQAHPDRQQALAGFAREEAAAIPRNAEERNYRDPHPKPEILYALSRFWVMRGFRPPADIHRLLEESGLLRYLPEAATLQQAPATAALRAFFTTLMGLPQERRQGLVERAMKAAGSRCAEADAGYEWIPRLAETTGADDVGVLAPLFLHVFALAPGEALFTGPGVLHAYLEGFGVELMANSDNVLRGGVTTKHVDTSELLAILRFEPTAPSLLPPELEGEGVEHFTAPQGALRLSRLRVRSGRPYESPTVRGAELLLATEGEGTIAVSAQQATEIPFTKGDSFLVPAAVPVYCIQGAATIFRAAAEGHPPEDFASGRE